MMENLYYGRGKDEDNKKLIAFLDDVFFSEETDGTNFFDLLPKIYKDKYRPAYNNFAVQDSDGNFCSAIGNFYCPLAVGGEDLNACCIGNVAVGKNCRSKGYMKDLMKMSVEDMKNNGVDMAFLGGQRQRYSYFGFESAGTRYVFYANRQNIKHSFNNEPSGFTVEKLSPDDTATIEKIIKISSSNPVYAKRTVENCFDVLCSWNNVPYILLNNGEFAGYFSADANKIEHILECGVTDKKYFKNMLLAIFETSTEKGIEFPVAPYETDKIEFFTKNLEGLNITGCESLLMYNFEKVIRAFLKAKASYSKLCDGEITVLIHGIKCDEKIKIKVSNNVPSVEKFDGTPDFEMEHHEATRAFFSNFTSDRSIFPASAQQWLPLNVYLSSCDTM
ncbi:MAG: GNAT family N-acetyltransferase [Ruminococcus sp.]|nr:GNAT family N-acetyltransferase [Candidatus Copronaster equi]